MNQVSGSLLGAKTAFSFHQTEMAHCPEKSVENDLNHILSDVINQTPHLYPVAYSHTDMPLFFFVYISPVSRILLKGHNPLCVPVLSVLSLLCMPEYVSGDRCIHSLKKKSPAGCPFTVLNCTGRGLREIALSGSVVLAVTLPHDQCRIINEKLYGTWLTSK